MPQKQTGLIVQDHVIRFAGLKNRELKNLRYNEEFLPPGLIRNGRIEDFDQCAKILKSAVKRWKIRGGKVLFTVPDSCVILRILELPGSLSDNDLRAYFVTELEQKIQLPFESPVFDFHTIVRTAVSTKVILFAAPEEVVRDYRELLKKCGLKPVAADLSMLAADRFYQSLDLPENAADHRMIIQLDLSSVNISIFHEGIPLFMRNILLDVSEQEGEEESLLKVSSEISRILSFYQFTVQKGSGSVSQIYLIGDHPFIGSYQEAILSATDLPILELSNQGGDPIPPQYYTVAGLALK